MTEATVAIAALASMLVAHFVWSAYMQRQLLRQIELDRKSLDTARIEIVSLKNPNAAYVSIQADQARTAASVAKFMEQQSGLVGLSDPDEEQYG